MATLTDLEYGYRTGRQDPVTKVVPASDPVPRNTAVPQGEGLQAEKVIKGLFTGTINFPVAIQPPANGKAFTITASITTYTGIIVDWTTNVNRGSVLVSPVYRFNVTTSGAGLGNITPSVFFAVQGNGVNLFTVEGHDLWSRCNFAGTQNGGGFRVINASFGNVVFDVQFAATLASITVNITTFTFTAGELLLNATTNGRVRCQGSTDPGASTVYSSFDAVRWRFRQAAGEEANAGTIAYRLFFDNALEIVGSGTTGANRLIRLYDCVSIGVNPSAIYGLLLASTLRTQASVTAGAGTNLALLDVTGTIVEATSGNHTRLSLIEFAALTVTAGAATVTNATTVYIAGAPAAVVTGKNRALWVVAGESEFGGLVTIGLDRGLDLRNQTNQAAAAAGTLGNAPVAGNPAIWIPVVVNGVNRAIPAW